MEHKKQETVARELSVERNYCASATPVLPVLKRYKLYYRTTKNRFVALAPDDNATNIEARLRDPTPPAEDVVVPPGPEREKWASKTEFILSCMGYAIGIGNVWRFPYLCYRNGGGAFLVPFITMLFFCGIPLFFMETCIGQFAGTGCITMFRMAPLFKGCGYAMILVNFMCTVYYNLILAYPLLFIYHCLQSEVPWKYCNNSWNTPDCVMLGENNINLSKNGFHTAAEEFFHNKILEISDDVTHQDYIVVPILIVNILSWLIVFCCIINGLKSVGKVVYVTVSFPYFILIAMFVRGITLPGAWEGIRYYIIPKWAELANIRVWSDAAVQTFYSLGPGWGGIVNMASYNAFNNHTMADSFFITIINVVTSIFAGFVVFSVLGFMSTTTGLTISEVATGGAGLAFVTYPEAITLMPWPVMWALLFFCMLYLLGIDSCFVQIECIISSLCDEYPAIYVYKKYVTAGSIFMMFIGSLSCTTNGGIYVLQLLDWYSCPAPVVVICLCESIIIGYVYNCDNFLRDVEFMIDTKLSVWWKICWKYLTPVVVFCLLVSVVGFSTRLTYNGVSYPDHVIAIGWITAATSVAFIPCYMMYFLQTQVTGTLHERFAKSLRYTSEWGPTKPEDRSRWKAMIASRGDPY